MGELQISVSDILKRPLFKVAKVVAGLEGIDRHVKWAHVLEVQEFDSLINGGELILTTGVGLQTDLATQLKYLKRLIEKDAAGICIELGPYFAEIPHELIQLAEKHQFPLIVFEETVKFVDITQDLHTMIINQHHALLAQLDNLSRKFIDLSLTPNGILKILQEIHLFFKQGTLFIGDNEKSHYYPSEIKVVEHALQQNIALFSSSPPDEQIVTIDGRSFAFVPVRGLGQLLGFICLEIEEPRTDDMTFLILDRAALAIAQVLLRNRTIAERKQKSEGEFVRNLLNGRDVDQDELYSFLPAPSNNMHYRIFTIHINDLGLDAAGEDWEEIRIQRSMTIRTLFNRHGFFPAVSSVKNEIVIIASFLSDPEQKKNTDRFLQVLRQIEHFSHPDYLLGSACQFGISAVHHDIKDIKLGYEESRIVLNLHRTGLITTYFYEKLGVYRLLFELSGSSQLQSFVDDYIAPVIAHDQQNDSELYETLRVYLECCGSKKETADRLFIVRQTLYHRIEKLEALLGKDFMEPSKRLAIEMTIHAYQFMHSQTSIKSKLSF